MSKRRKFYVVWVGHNPGIYDTWNDAQEQVINFPGAKYKSYDDIDEATAAYRGDPREQLGLMRALLQRKPDFNPSVRDSNTSKPDISTSVRDYSTLPGIRLDAIAVDGACAGNPGRMEYRAVRVADGAEVFRIGDKMELTGTNNIAEYLGMIHLAALLARNGDFTTPIYTDSRNTLAWLRRGHSKTTLVPSPATAKTLELLARADAWLAANGPIRNPIIKWPTEEWGEIPADFGRK